VVGGVELHAFTAYMPSVPAEPGINEQRAACFGQMLQPAGRRPPRPKYCSAALQLQLGDYYEAQLLQCRDAIIQPDLFDYFAVLET
jgi:hypothetical protein